MPLEIFVPRWMNRAITNAQSLNAKAMLSRFRDPRAQWTAMGNEQPPEEIAQKRDSHGRTFKVPPMGN